MKEKFMSNIRLERINDDNFYAITKLRTKKEQKDFVADNKYSLIHAYLEVIKNRPVFPFGIFDGDKPVGFLMITYDAFSDREIPAGHEKYVRNTYMIWRLMIDGRYQGKGYGREAMKLALDFIRTFPCGESEYCWLSYNMKNEGARALYRSFGFVEQTDVYVEGGEMPAVLKL